MARFWRGVYCGRNPLARASDRIEGAVLLVVVLGLFVALPLAVLAGFSSYRGQLAVAQQQQATRYLATATLIEAAPAVVPANEAAFAGNRTARVHARWTVAGGAERIGTIPADRGTAAGAHVPIWLTGSGDPAPVPLTTSDVTTTSVLAGVFTWVATAAGLVAVYWTTRTVLDRRRDRRWDREWLTAGQKWARS